MFAHLYIFFQVWVFKHDACTRVQSSDTLCGTCTQARYRNFVHCVEMGSVHKPGRSSVLCLGPVHKPCKGSLNCVGPVHRPGWNYLHCVGPIQRTQARLELCTLCRTCKCTAYIGQGRNCVHLENLSANVYERLSKF